MGEIKHTVIGISQLLVFEARGRNLPISVLQKFHLHLVSILTNKMLIVKSERWEEYLSNENPSYVSQVHEFNLLK